METKFYKSAGLSLILGSVLAIITMILHPSGGSIDHIIQTAQPIRFAHSLAISCLPFILFGFYGLTKRLSDSYKLSVLAFIIVTLSLFSAILAALFNGWVLPDFLSHYSDNMEQNISVIKPIMTFSFAINTALDYIFITAFCFAICVYSIIGIWSKNLPKWIGYFGTLIALLALVGGITNFAFTSLIGFRIFVFGIAGWILACGVLLFQTKSK